MQHKPTEQTWWLVTRRYTIEEQVAVEALSAQDAKAKVAEGDYEDVWEPARTVSGTTHRLAERLPGGKPERFWTEADYEAEAERG